MAVLAAPIGPLLLVGFVLTVAGSLGRRPHRSRLPVAGAYCALTGCALLVALMAWASVAGLPK